MSKNRHFTQEELQQIADEFYSAQQKRYTEHSDGYLFRWVERHGKDLLIALFKEYREET